MGPQVERVPDWPERLSAVVEAARHRPYDLGRWDCFRFACAAYEAVTGRRIGEEWEGRYASPKEALRLIREFGRGDEATAVSRLLGRDPVPVLMAQRGDWMLYRDGRGPHLGICLGDRIAVLADDGLRFLPLRAAEAAWRV